MDDWGIGYGDIGYEKIRNPKSLLSSLKHFFLGPFILFHWSLATAAKQPVPTPRSLVPFLSPVTDHQPPVTTT
jgi:hypothetical protein